MKYEHITDRVLLMSFDFDYPPCNLMRMPSFNEPSLIFSIFKGVMLANVVKL